MEQPEIPGITNVQKICPSEQPKKKKEAVMSLVHMDQSQKESRHRGKRDKQRDRERERENEE